MSTSLTKTLRTLGLAAALMGPALGQGALARTAWTVDGPIDLPAVSRNAAPQGTADVNPALNTLEESGATGGDGQHS
ncbi:hypothetical protein [Roseomonas sp. WA12]